MRTILAWSVAAILAMAALTALWAQAMQPTAAEMWVVCVEESEPTDANMRACDDTYGEHDMRVLRP